MSSPKIDYWVFHSFNLFKQIISTWTRITEKSGCFKDHILTNP